MQLRHITVDGQHVIKLHTERGIAHKHDKKTSAPVKSVHLM